MSKNVVIIGAGGHAKVIADIIEKVGAVLGRDAGNWKSRQYTWDSRRTENSAVV